MLDSSWILYEPALTADTNLANKPLPRSSQVKGGLYS